LTRAIVAVTGMVALTIPLAGGTARAGDDSASDTESSATLRAQADAIADRYLAALTRYQTLDRAITDAQAEIKVLRTRAHTARVEARRRAVTAYLGASARLPSVVGSTDAIDAARRIQLIDQVNGRTRAAYARLRVATSELDDRRRALESDREHQADALDDLTAQGTAMDAKLARAQQREQAAHAAVLAAQAAQAAVQAPTTAPAASQPLDPRSTTTTRPAVSAPATPPAPPPAPMPPPDYAGTPGTNAHHDDPFLTCVRARESGGYYGAVNPSGPYLGAYQFLQATWNGTANHAGRADLVGVPANLATPYDQDELAWALYQWQGMGPWGGGCP
jgi:peptidoglycan hydrolase CwlO-like protein